MGLHSVSRWDWLKNLTVKREYLAIACLPFDDDYNCSGIWRCLTDEHHFKNTNDAIEWVVDGLIVEGDIESFADLDYLRISRRWTFFNRIHTTETDLYVHDLDKDPPCCLSEDIDTCPCMDGDEDGCSAGIHIDNWDEMKDCDCFICTEQEA